MVSNVDYPTGGGHLTSPDTQTNWNGILGDIRLSIYDTIHINQIKTQVDYDSRMLTATMIATNHSECDFTGYLNSRCIPVTIDNYNTELNSSELISLIDNEAVTLVPGENEVTFTTTLPDSLSDWDEYNPSVIRLSASISSNCALPDNCAQSGNTSTCSASSDCPKECSSEIVSVSDSISTWFGIRKFEARDMHFYINDRRTFLRGKHDGMIFPLTGYAPMDVDSWIKVMKTAKRYGINHYRCHTCCPPEAAFLAADLLGIYYQPELPFWGSFYAETDAEYEDHRVSQDYLTQEGYRLLDQFGNHPSFVMMSMGNELWGSPEAINVLVENYKKYDSRHLYTQGSNNFQWMPNIQSGDDFFSGVRFSKPRQIRGSYAQCDEPLGHVQTQKPGTLTSYEAAIFPFAESAVSSTAIPGSANSEDAITTGSSSTVSSAGASSVSESLTDGDTIQIQYGTGVKEVKKTQEDAFIPNIPVVSHEIGQYETYPNYNETSKYTGVLQARNFEIFKERLADAGLADLAMEYHKNSGALAVACYKDELETALRTPSMAGIQILDIQDFSGQGTALVGILDAFMDNKGLVTPMKWRQFCSDAVAQLGFSSYILESGATLTLTPSVSWYRQTAPGKSKLRLFFDDAMKTCTGTCGNLKCRKPCTEIDIEINENGVHIYDAITLNVPDVEVPSIYNLAINIDGTDVTNSYEMWVYPTACNCDMSVLVPTVSEAVDRSNRGLASVVCLTKDKNINSIEGTYATDFWCYPMFRSISESMNKKTPIGTMGLLIKDDHPALNSFLTRTYSTPQWFDAVMNGSSTILDETEIKPIAQMIDNFERNHKLGFIYEFIPEGGSAPILMCCSPLDKLAESGSIECAWLLKSMCDYVAEINKKGDMAHANIASLSVELIKKLFY
ncbi:MAG: beta-glucuronidase [Lachnospiraceae bacterium]|nr:beta-glucuronidase [Candidatus Merdinaster equi]